MTDEIKVDGEDTNATPPSVEEQAAIDAAKAEEEAAAKKQADLEAAAADKPKRSHSKKSDEEPPPRYYGDYIPEGTPEYKAAAKAKDSQQMPDYVPATFDCKFCDYKGPSEKALVGHMSAKHK